MKRSQPLARNTPLKRSRMKRGPSRRSLNRTLGAALYLRWIHAQFCCVPDSFGHFGRTEQSHGRNLRGPTGLGLKENDFASVPMCSAHHRAWEERGGLFSGWSREQRRNWMIAAIAEAHLSFQLEGGVVA